MSHFSATLRSLLNNSQPKLTQEQLAEKSQVDRTLISKMLRGTLPPTRAKLAALCKAVSDDPQHRAELLVAHLRDEAAQAFATGALREDDVRIESAGRDFVVSERSAGVESVYLSFPQDLRSQLEDIGREALRIEEMAALVQQWSDAIRRYATERASAHSPTTTEEGGGVSSMSSPSVRPKVSQDVIDAETAERDRQRRIDKKTS